MKHEITIDRTVIEQVSEALEMLTTGTQKRGDSTWEILGEAMERGIVAYDALLNALTELEAADAALRFEVESSRPITPITDPATIRALFEKDQEQS